jgi:MFS family permease
MVFYAILMYVSVYFEFVLNHSAFKSGVGLLPVIVAAMVSSIVSGALSSRKQIMKPLMVSGCCLLAIGSGLVTLFNVDTSSGGHIGYLIFIGTGYGLLLQPAMLSAQCTVAEDAVIRKLILTAFLTYSRSLGAAAGGIVATAIYSSVANAKLADSQIFGSSPDINEVLEVSGSGRLSASQQKVINEALETALRGVFWACVVMALLAFLTSLFANDDSRSKQAFMDPNLGSNNGASKEGEEAENYAETDHSTV